MKKILGLLLLVAPTIALAQDSRPRMLMTAAPCDQIDKIFSTVFNYQEQLLFIGQGMTFAPSGTPYNGGLFFFTNQDTGTFSVVQVFADGVACMIMNGTQFEPYSGEQPEYQPPGVQQ